MAPARRMGGRSLTHRGFVWGCRSSEKLREVAEAAQARGCVWARPGQGREWICVCVGYGPTNALVLGPTGLLQPDVGMAVG